MSATQDGNLDECKRLIQKTALNRRVDWPVLESAFCINEREFYKTKTGSAQSAQILFEITPLILATMCCPALPRCAESGRSIESMPDIREQIVMTLLEAGANRQVKDKTKLTSYDHARILKLNDQLVRRLDPSVEAMSVIAAVRARNVPCGIAREDLCHALDTQWLSPVALATNWYFCRNMLTSRCWDGVLFYESIEKLIVAKASLFAQYNSETENIPSLALRWAFALCYERSLLESRELDFMEYVRGIPRPIFRNDAEVMEGWMSRHIEKLSKEKKSALRSPTSIFAREHDLLTTLAVLDRWDLAQKCLDLVKENWDDSSLDSLIRWPLYIATRLGRAAFLQSLSAFSPRVAHDATTLPRNALEQSWPLKCDCAPEIHVQRNKSSVQYCEELRSANLCQWCRSITFHLELDGDLLQDLRLFQ